jgi:hypothetical protein
MMRDVFARLSETEARAVYEALAQWCENEATRYDVEDPYAETPELRAVERVVERCDAVRAAAVPGGRLLVTGEVVPPDPS